MIESSTTSASGRSSVGVGAAFGHEEKSDSTGVGNDSGSLGASTFEQLVASFGGGHHRQPDSLFTLLCCVEFIFELDYAVGGCVELLTKLEHLGGEILLDHSRVVTLVHEGEIRCRPNARHCAPLG